MPSSSDDSPFTVSKSRRRCSLSHSISLCLAIPYSSPSRRKDAYISSTTSRVQYKSFSARWTPRFKSFPNFSLSALYRSAISRARFTAYSRFVPSNLSGGSTLSSLAFVIALPSSICFASTMLAHITGFSRRSCRSRNFRRVEFSELFSCRSEINLLSIKPLGDPRAESTLICVGTCSIRSPFSISVKAWS